MGHTQHIRARGKEMRYMVAVILHIVEGLTQGIALRGKSVNRTG